MTKKQKVVFLDRDGVINYNPVYRDYIRKASQFRFIPGARRAIRLLTEAGFDIVVTSNQAGVARGFFTKEDLKRIDQKMHKGIKQSRGRIRKSCYCIHHPEAGCACRKPLTGLLTRAIAKSKVDLSSSFFIGDTARDTHAGKNFGVKTIAVLSGYAARKDIKKWDVQPDYIADDLISAVKEIILVDSF